ncbi:hypothetical protein D7Z54_17935 [Salibacterium salarium]|uniref:Uncharacterized protein n=1 Tax=Salibacterium salarium TaxID=284579 RepID=A0A3R9QJY9_9BACI|nr:hypothetical protein [Salibacterium salarium]RSL32076.1 hypothetical protein D7Z54_17935 [Salibacterium salarium]
MSPNYKEDQAEQLRKRSQRHSEEAMEEEKIPVSSLPSRKETHKNTRKKVKLRIHFPLARLLLLIFIVIVVLAVLTPFWLEK